MSAPKGKGKGKRRSWVWEHFNIFDEDDMVLSRCIHCQEKVYRAESNLGTSNQSNHLKICDAYKKLKCSQSLSKFDQKVYCALWARAIICHAYPIQIVEHVRIRELHEYLNPNVRHVSRNTILKHCRREYDAQKLILSKVLSELPCRISFTCDVWSACTSRGYIVLTAHFVNSNWKLQSIILSFRYFPPPHNGKDIYKFAVDLIDEWGLKGKVFSITVDNASANDVAVDELRKDLLETHSLPCDGKFLHIRCAAHILNLIVRAGLALVDESVVKLRLIAKYIEWSDSRLTRFEEACRSSNSGFSGRLKLDVSTRWNSTYLMLRKCLEAKVGIDRFCVLESGIPYFIDANEWQTVQNVCDFLEAFYDVTVLFSGSDYPTANLYFENVVYIEHLLVKAHADPSDCIKKMAAPMLEKFSKYWENYTSIFAVAVMLDPRYKINYVKEMYGILYEDEEVNRKVQEAYNAFTELYEYYSQSVTPTTSSSSSRSSTSSSRSATFSSSAANSFLRPYMKPSLKVTKF